MDDAEIIQLYFDRVERAITETEKKFGRMCRSIAYRMLRSHEDAEECESDTYLRAWNTIPPTRPAVLAAYLGRITRNLALDRYTYLHAEKRGGGELPLLLDELEACIADGSSFDRLSDIELREILNRFMDGLSPDAAKIFMRRYWFGDSVAEIAEACAFSAGKVKMSLMRTRRELKKALEREGYTI